MFTNAYKTFFHILVCESSSVRASLYDKGRILGIILIPVENTRMAHYDLCFLTTELRYKCCH